MDTNKEIYYSGKLLYGEVSNEILSKADDLGVITEMEGSLQKFIAV